jgi:hypothetical protein
MDGQTRRGRFGMPARTGQGGSVGNGAGDLPTRASCGSTRWSRTASAAP